MSIAIGISLRAVLESMLLAHKTLRAFAQELLFAGKVEIHPGRSKKNRAKCRLDAANGVESQAALPTVSFRRRGET